MLLGDGVVIVAVDVVMTGAVVVRVVIGMVVVTRDLRGSVVVPVREGSAGDGKAARDREQAGEQAVGQGADHDRKLALAPR